MKYSNDRIGKCAELFLERRGYAIRERFESEGATVVVAENDEAIAIAKVSASEDGFPDDVLDRETFERIAAEYLANHPDSVDRSVRADHIGIRIIGGDRAFIRHISDTSPAWA